MDKNVGTALGRAKQIAGLLPAYVDNCTTESLATQVLALAAIDIAESLRRLVAGQAGDQSFQQREWRRDHPEPEAGCSEPWAAIQAARVLVDSRELYAPDAFKSVVSREALDALSRALGRRVELGEGVES